MIIACKCEKCGNIFMNQEDDLCLEIDFKERKISFLCRNKNCRHENIIDLRTWKDDQGYSPLPPIGVV